MKNNIEVSVCVVTYCHAPFIRECLESICNQKTSFSFEVIVGEDCSPDDTATIVKDVQQQFPDKVVPIFRKENVGGHLNFLDTFKMAQGKYIAYCEGDDFWVDLNKLQKQFDILESHPGIDLSFHSAIEVWGNRKVRIIKKHSDIPEVFNIDDVILGRGGFMHSGSWFLRRSALVPFPVWFEGEIPVGDTFIQILLSKRGGAHYSPDAMSAYRRFTASSHTQGNHVLSMSEDAISSKALLYRNAYANTLDSIGLQHRSAINVALALDLLNLATHALRSGHRKLFSDLVDEVRPHLLFKNKFFWLMMAARYFSPLQSVVLKRTSTLYRRVSSSGT